MEKQKEFILNLVKQQVQPALGCTEIGIVSLAAAKCSSMLKGSQIKKCVLTISPYIYRNDARVGVPMLGCCGIKSIVAAGLILKNPEKQLSCLEDLSSKTIKQSLKMGAESDHTIEVKVDYKSEPVFTNCVAIDELGNKADVTIKYKHNKIVSAKLNGKETVGASNSKDKTAIEVCYDNLVDYLSFEEAYDVCKKTSLSELKFLHDGIKMNSEIMNEGEHKPEKDSLSYVWKNIIKGNKLDNYGIKKDSWIVEVLSKTCYAIDARMYGCPLPVMTSAGSGDHGLTVLIPQMVYAKYFKIDELKMLQATLFAHFVTWKIKSKVGHVCGLCGSAVGAGAGAVAGLAFQMGWDFGRINNLINMHFVSQSGIICDGAKPSCSFKVLASLVSGILSLILADANGAILHKDGVVHKSIDQTLNYLGKISKDTQDESVKSVVGVLDVLSKE